MSENILICTVGLPRSGKTTWARKQDLPIVNPDSIRLALHGQPFSKPAEPFVWAIAKVMVSALFQAGHSRVILDATNTTRKRRDEWASSDWLTLFHEVPASKHTCLDRAEPSVPGFDLKPVIERMAENFEPIQSDEIRYLN